MRNERVRVEKGEVGIEEGGRGLEGWTDTEGDGGVWSVELGKPARITG
jgi:hypothetical protein